MLMLRKAKLRTSLLERVLLTNFGSSKYTLTTYQNFELRRYEYQGCFEEIFKLYRYNEFLVIELEIYLKIASSL